MQQPTIDSVLRHPGAPNITIMPGLSFWPGRSRPQSSRKLVSPYLRGRQGEACRIPTRGRCRLVARSEPRRGSPDCDVAYGRQHAQGAVGLFRGSRKGEGRRGAATGRALVGRPWPNPGSRRCRRSLSCLSPKRRDRCGDCGSESRRVTAGNSPSGRIKEGNIHRDA